MKNLHGKVAFITGAAGGIGRCCALALAREGSDVIVADLDVKSAKAVAAEIRTLGRAATALQLNVADEAAFKEAAEKAIAWKGKVDILINNAGIMVGGSATETPAEQWQKVFAVNVFGAVNGVKAFSEHMKQQGSGQIVNIASLFGLMHLPFVSAYCMTKASVLAFTNSLRAEMLPFNIGVTCICPGSVETGLIKNGHWAESKGGGFIPEMFGKNFKSTPESIALETVKGIKKNKRLVLAGKDAKILGPLISWFPSMFASSFAKVGKDYK